MKEESGPPPPPNYNGGINHPRKNGCLLPSPLQVEQERILKEAQALAAAQQAAPRKSFNTIERERLQDQANERTVGIQRGSWAG